MDVALMVTMRTRWALSAALAVTLLTASPAPTYARFRALERIGKISAAKRRLRCLFGAVRMMAPAEGRGSFEPSDTLVVEALRSVGASIRGHQVVLPRHGLSPRPPATLDRCEAGKLMLFAHNRGVRPHRTLQVLADATRATRPLTRRERAHIARFGLTVRSTDALGRNIRGESVALRQILETVHKLVTDQDVLDRADLRVLDQLGAHDLTHINSGGPSTRNYVLTAVLLGEANVGADGGASFEARTRHALAMLLGARQAFSQGTAPAVGGWWWARHGRRDVVIRARRDAHSQLRKLGLALPEHMTLDELVEQVAQDVTAGLALSGVGARESEAYDVAPPRPARTSETKHDDEPSALPAHAQRAALGTEIPFAVPADLGDEDVRRDSAGDLVPAIGIQPLPMASQNPAELAREDAEYLLRLGRASLTLWLEEGLEIPTPEDLPDALQAHKGMWLSAYTHPGRMHRISWGALYEPPSLAEAVVNSGRLLGIETPPGVARLTASDLKHIVLELTVCKEAVPLDTWQIELGNGACLPQQAGIIMEDAGRRIVVPPHVVDRTPGTLSAILDHLCGRCELSPSWWREPTTTVSWFTTDAFAERSPVGEIHRVEAPVHQR